jgi:hypothetical protein
MPPRIVTWTIVVFWLAMMGLLFYRDLWPQLLSGEPPPLAIDKMDEIKGASARLPWKVAKNGQVARSGHEIYTLNTWVDHNEVDDTFQMHAELKRQPEADVIEAARQYGSDQLPQFHNIRMTSTYHATRSGELLDLDIDIDFSLSLEGSSETVHAVFSGEPKDRRLTPRLKIDFGEGAEEKRDLETVAVSRRGIVLNPLHPLHRLPDLRPGQSWEVPVLDPLNLLVLADAVVALLDRESLPAEERTKVRRQWQSLKQTLGTQGGVQRLRAEVQPGPQEHGWSGKKWPCYEVRYRGDGPATVLIITWVRASDGLVLEQDVYLGLVLQGEPLVADHWVLVRERE